MPLAPRGRDRREIGGGDCLRFEEDWTGHVRVVVRGKALQCLGRGDLELGKRGAELNERLGLDAFRQAQQNAVNHAGEQFLRPVAATTEQLHNAG